MKQPQKKPNKILTPEEMIRKAFTGNPKDKSITESKEAELKKIIDN